MCRKKYIPSFICGDLDSAEGSVVRFYESEVRNEGAVDGVDTGVYCVGLHGNTT